MDDDEVNLSSITHNVSYEKLIKLDEKYFEDILRFQKNKQRVIKIANDCILSFEKNILKNYSLLICIDKICSFKDIKILDSKKLEEIFYKFKKEFSEYKNNFEQKSISESNHNDKDKSKNDNLNAIQLKQIEKRLDFLRFIIKILGELKQYNILKEILMDQIFLNQEQKKLIINQFIYQLIEKRESFIIQEIKFYEFLILEFNYLENNLEYKNIENNNINYEIQWYKEVENMKYLNEFIRSFCKQKDKDVIEEMKIFLFNFFNSIKSLNSLFIKCNDYLNEFSEYSNIIDLFKYIINNSEKNCLLTIKSLSSLSRKSIFKFTITFKAQIKNLYFYGNTRINEINNYLNNNLKSFKNNDDEYFMIEYENNKTYKENISLDEFNYSNKTLNELGELNYVIKSEIRREIFTKEKFLDQNNNLTERFKSAIIKWFKIFSKGKSKMNRADIADCFNKLSGKKEPIFTEMSPKILHFFRYNSKSLEKITFDEFKAFFEKACINNYKNVIINIKNMNQTPDLTEIPQEIDNNKLPRYYLSNKVEEFKESYLWKSILNNFSYSLRGDIFDFMSFLSVNEDIYNSVLNDFNKKDSMKFTKNNNYYIKKLYTLYIIESIIEDVEIFNNKDGINDNQESQKEKILYENIYSQEINPMEKKKILIKKINFL